MFNIYTTQHVAVCVHILMFMSKNVKVCVLLGTRGSIRGSGHVAQMQVFEGKEGKALLEVWAHVQL